MTNVKHHKIYSVVLHSGGSAWYYTSWNCKHDVDSSESAAAKLIEVIKELQSENVLIVALVTDNASNMVGARKLVNAATGVLDVGCAAHVVHNSAMHLLNDAGLNSILDPFNKVITLSGYKDTGVITNVSTVDEWLLESGPKLLKLLNIPTNDYTGAQLQHQVAEMETEAGNWALTKVERSTMTQRKLVHPMQYYTRRLEHADTNLLSIVATTLLAIVPSEASVERTFSALKMQWTPRRNQLQVDTVEDLLQLQLNSSQLRSTSELAGGQQPSTKYQLVEEVSVAQEGLAEAQNEQAADVDDGADGVHVLDEIYNM